MTVVVLESLSYTGTTWLNLILGCHDRAFATGPADRVVRIDDPSQACRIHGADCAFWPAFLRKYDRDANFFLQLVEHSQRDFIVTNNLSPDGLARDLAHPDVILKRIRVVRDGRALMASWLRNYASQGKGVFDAVTEFLLPGMSSFHWDPQNSSALAIRYEDMVREPSMWLEAISHFTGLDYTTEALEFWDHPLHPIAGNQGTISLIKFAQGISVHNFNNRSFYEAELERLKASSQFRYDRWKDNLSAGQRFIFDLGCGDLNESFGYPRDRFSLDEIRLFVEELAEYHRQIVLPQPLLDALGRLLGGFSGLSSGFPEGESSTNLRELVGRFTTTCRSKGPRFVARRLQSVREQVRSQSRRLARRLLP